MSLPIRNFLGKSQLFQLNTLDLPDGVEHALFYRYSLLQKEWKGQSLEAINSQLIKQASRSPEAYSDVIQGLLFGILSDKDNALQFFQLAQSCINDGWSLLVEQLKYFTFTKFLQTTLTVREQLFWLVDRLLALNVKGTDGLYIGLLRQIKPGNRTDDNVWLLTSVLNLSKEHKSWFLDSPSVIPYSLYAFLRILSEGFVDILCQQTLIDLCINMLYERYRECSLLGRDLARALLEVCQIPEIQKFWLWLLRPSTEVAPIVRLLLTPTPKKYLVMRLTPDMESQLQFLLEKCKTAQQNFYVSLFVQAHLPNGPHDDPGAMITDLIRYIVVVHHPSNAVLASPNIQRWSLIVDLLKSLKSSFSAASCKLSLFFDWFFFNPSSDSIMLIEPGLLVMFKSIVNHPNITATLLEFLLFMRRDFYPPLAEDCSNCIDKVLVSGIEKGVVPPLQGLLASPLLDPGIKLMAIKVFPSSNNQGEGRASPKSGKELLLDVLYGHTEDLVGKELAEEAAQSFEGWILELEESGKFLWSESLEKSLIVAMKLGIKPEIMGRLICRAFFTGTTTSTERLKKILDLRDKRVIDYFLTSLISNVSSCSDNVQANLVDFVPLWVWYIPSQTLESLGVRLISDLFSKISHDGRVAFLNSAASALTTRGIEEMPWPPDCPYRELWLRCKENGVKSQMTDRSV